MAIGYELSTGGFRGPGYAAGRAGRPAGRLPGWPVSSGVGWLAPWPAGWLAARRCPPGPPGYLAAWLVPPGACCWLVPAGWCRLVQPGVGCRLAPEGVVVVGVLIARRQRSTCCKEVHAKMLDPRQGQPAAPIAMLTCGGPLLGSRSVSLGAHRCVVSEAATGVRCLQNKRPTASRTFF